MKEMPDKSVDSIVTDPPYELGFMGKSWDASGIAFNVEVWREALRVLKPGGHLIAFSGSRTYHRMAVAIEDAGFQIRDQIMWLYGSGFPKSHNISKALDKAAGAEREVIGSRPLTGNGKTLKSGFHQPDGTGAGETIKEDVYEFTAPSTKQAQQWDGWGTALKPAHEPMVLARKSLEGTVINNVMTYGTGALNIKSSRIGSGTGESKIVSYPDIRNNNYNNASGTIEYTVTDEGRWPANVIHNGLETEWARFFYCPKASKRDRNEGLDGFEVKRPDTRTKTGMGTFDEKGIAAQTNHHPTVKPTALMQYLVRLITPPNGTVLDPFMGSGSTGKAALIEGFDFIGIDQSSEYVKIAKARLEYVKSDTPS